MAISEFCCTEVAVVEKNSSIHEAARKMRELHLGDVVVVETTGDVSRPIGILTDRDIVVGLVALGISTDSVRVDDVMTPTLVTINHRESVHETIHLMETYGVRRLPVVDDDGCLTGIISSGDLLKLIGNELAALSRLPARQKLKEQEIRL
jgi:predicted transcriptional regulator